jgi:hypothetical protein
MSEEIKPNIYQRVNKVQQAIKYIRKDKKITGGGQNYSAVSHDALVAVIRDKLVEHGIVTHPEQVSGQILIKRDKANDIAMHLYEGNYNINLVNIDNPEDRIVIPIQAHAADNGDKAPGKAITYATKSALLKAFCLETGDDEESRTHEDDPDAYLAEELLTITSSTTMDELASSFRTLFAKYKADKKAVAFITAEKDKMKKKLGEQS